MEGEIHAVVTGGNDGIGFELCKFLASKGCVVFLCCRDESKGQVAQRKILDEQPGSKVHVVKLQA